MRAGHNRRIRPASLKPSQQPAPTKPGLPFVAPSKAPARCNGPQGNGSCTFSQAQHGRSS
eukprot:7176766-Lingulodinium_polyedra.AAC.1